MTETPLLEIDHVSVVYPQRRHTPAHVAVDDVSMTVARGETVGIVGESGSGKSSLGNAVLGLVPITSGAIRFDGRDITHLSHADRRSLSRDIQAIFQDPYSSLNPHRTVGQSVMETLAGTSRKTRAEDRTRAVDLLARVGLDQTAFDRFPGQFSGGQRQRIAIARALLPGPQLIVCDEVVSALDLSVQAQVINLLLELQREHSLSYVFITHDLSVVRHLCQRVLVLRKGRVVETGEMHEVMHNPQDPYTQRLILAAPAVDPTEQKERRLARRQFVI